MAERAAPALPPWARACDAFALGLVLLAHRRISRVDTDRPALGDVVVNVLPPVLMGGVLSMGRVTSTIFPIFLWLATAIPAAHRSAWLMAFAMVQALGAIAFFTWRQLY